MLASITTRGRKGKSAAADSLTADYIGRASRLQPTSIVTCSSEAELLQAAERQPGRPAAQLVLFDSRGDLLDSDGFAQALGRFRDAGIPRLMFAIGPPDGWSDGTRAQAVRSLSLGRMTLPHELARVVAAEQIYRALTTLAGHPYHCGH